MISWNKLPKEIQKAILSLVVISTGAATTHCIPQICDPVPPPASATPTQTRTPLICDPPPPPASVTPTKSKTPMICDPLPPPSATPKPVMSPIICDAAPPPPRTPTGVRTPMICDPLPAPSVVPSTRRFQLRSLQMSTDSTLKGAAVRGSIFDAQGQPLADIKVSVQSGSTVIDATTTRNGSFFIRVPNPGSYTLIVGDKSNSLPLQLKQYDVADVEWYELKAPPQAALPLAEIRLVDIVWGDDLTFTAESPWADARYRWSVSGGTLIEEDERVMWQPPIEPGHYLLQVIADWGQAGLAVDVLTLAVTDNGIVVVG